MLVPDWPGLHRNDGFGGRSGHTGLTVAIMAGSDSPGQARPGKTVRTQPRRRRHVCRGMPRATRMKLRTIPWTYPNMRSGCFTCLPRGGHILVDNACITGDDRFWKGCTLPLFRQLKRRRCSACARVGQLPLTGWAHRTARLPCVTPPPPPGHLPAGGRQWPRQCAPGQSWRRHRDRQGCAPP